MAREGNRSLNDVVYEKNRPFTILMEYSGDNLIYVGKAKCGTATSEAYWQIKKLTWSGSTCTAVKYASGVTTFTKEWDDRATYTYS